MIKQYIIYCILFVLLALSSHGHAATHNVSNDSELSTALISAVAGDIISVASGTYSTSLEFGSSGTSGNRITLQGASGSVVVFDQQGESNSRGIGLNNRDYITIQRGLGTSMTFTGALNNVYVNNSDNIILKDIIVGTSNGNVSAQRIYIVDSDFVTLDSVQGLNSYSVTAYASNWVSNCDYMEIKNSSFEHGHVAGHAQRDGIVFVDSKYAHIHDNFFGTATHTSFKISSGCDYWWVYDNTFTNSLRHALVIVRYLAPYTTPHHILVENNLVVDNATLAATNYPAETVPTNRPANSLKLGGNNLIIRNNTIVKSNMGIDFFLSNQAVDNIHAYHNTVYDNRTYDVNLNIRAGVGSSTYLLAVESLENVSFKNNVFSKMEGPDFYWTFVTGGTFTNINFENNFVGYTGDFYIRYKNNNYYTPTAINAHADWTGTIGAADPLLVAPDYTPAQGSPLIDAGVFLATVASVPDGTTINLGTNEANQFFDGYGISGATGDTIYDDDGNSTTVTAIVDHNTISVSDSTGFTTGDPITVVNYTSTRPDIGRYQYDGNPQNPTPIAAITSPVGSQSGSDPSSFSFSATCTDPDGDDVYGFWDFDGGAINYSCGLSSSPLTCNAGSTEISGVNNYNVVFTCTDEHGAASTQSVQITIGSPSAPTPQFEWNIEAANVVLDDQGNQNLDNNGTITTGGTEPDPPGYGSVGGVLDDSVPQYFSVSNANIGNNICNGTSTECTIIIAINADDLGSDYLFSFYHPGNGDRQYAIALYSGVPTLFWGYNSGGSYQELSLPVSYIAGEDIIIGLSIDTVAKTYTFLSQDVATGTYTAETEADVALLGTYDGTLGAQLVIGGRSDATATRAFDGTMYLAYGYNSELTRSQMETIFENTTSSSNIDKCYLGENKTYAASDTIDVCCDLISGITVGGDGSSTYALAGTPNTLADLQTGNGSDVTQLCWSGTIAGGTTHSGRITAASVDAIILNSTTLDGMSDDVATSGPGSIEYESEGYINTSSGGTFSAFEPCDSAGNVLTGNVDWVLGDTVYFKLTGSQAGYFNEGQVGNFMIPITLEAGGPLNLTFAPSQPSGMGNGTTDWIFSAEITSGMLDITVGGGVGSLDRDFITTGENTIIENSGGVEMSDYSIPAVSTDSIEINASSGIRRDFSATGSVSTQ